MFQKRRFRQVSKPPRDTLSHCTYCFPSSISDPFIFNMCSKDRSSDHYSCQRHSYGDLRELRQARFLLQVRPGRAQRKDYPFPNPQPKT